MNLIWAMALAAAALAALHWAWRRKFLRAQEAAARELERSNQAREQAAAQFQVQQEAIFNSMIEGLLFLDEQGRIQMANRAFTHLFDLATEVRSRTIMEALRLRELADLVEFLGKQKRVLGYVLQVPGAEERSLEVNGAAIFDGEGRRQGTILVFHDLTRLKQLESARTEFVANVSHELRTPLSLIKGYVETLLDGAKDNPDVASKFLHTIDRNAERLKLLIEDLLTISELESGRVALNPGGVSLRPAIEKVFADFKGRAEARAIKMVNEAGELRVRADPDRLEQVWGNLVDNAIKYGRRDGTLVAGARLGEDGFVEAFVKDDGPGIPDEALGRVFERFYRVDKARSREQGGTGLGLSIVKHIVQSHGGKVWARSELGHGATFYFTLPQDV